MYVSMHVTVPTRSRYVFGFLALTEGYSVGTATGGRKPQETIRNYIGISDRLKFRYGWAGLITERCETQIRDRYVSTHMTV